MADLSDEDLTTIIATVTGDQSDLSGDARFEAMRAAIASDRALTAAPSVGAEGLPPLPEPEKYWDEHTNMYFASSTFSADQMRAYALAALASRPAVDAWQPIETAPKDGTRVALATAESAHAGQWSASQYSGMWWMAGDYVAAFSKIKPPTHWMPLPAAPAARHPAQREGE